MNLGWISRSLLVWLASSGLLQAQSASFNYQGRLLSGAQPANGSYDLSFRLLDNPTNDNQVAAALTNAPVFVTNGLFSVTLDFGVGAFDGSARWLEIGVRTNGGTEPYTTLSPRQQVTFVPQSLFALASVSATLATNLVGGGAGLTNLSGAALQPGTVTSDALDSTTRGTLGAFALSFNNTWNSNLIFVAGTTDDIVNGKYFMAGPQWYTNGAGSSLIFDNWSCYGTWIFTNANGVDYCEDGSLIEFYDVNGSTDPVFGTSYSLDGSMPWGGTISYGINPASPAVTLTTPLTATQILTTADLLVSGLLTATQPARFGTLTADLVAGNGTGLTNLYGPLRLPAASGSNAVVIQDNQTSPPTALLWQTGTNHTLGGSFAGAFSGDGMALTNLSVTPVLNVRLPPFNAVGDGVSDDWAALQAAINCASTGLVRRVFLPAGTYLISDSLIIPPGPPGLFGYSSIELFGAGPVVTTILSTNRNRDALHYGVGTAGPTLFSFYLHHLGLMGPGSATGGALVRVGRTDLTCCGVFLGCTNDGAGRPLVWDSQTDQQPVGGAGYAYEPVIESCHIAGFDIGVAIVASVNASIQSCAIAGNMKAGVLLAWCDTGSINNSAVVSQFLDDYTPLASYAKGDIWIISGYNNCIRSTEFGTHIPGLYLDSAFVTVIGGDLEPNPTPWWPHGAILTNGTSLYVNGLLCLMPGNTDANGNYTNAIFDCWDNQGMGRLTLDNCVNGDNSAIASLHNGFQYPVLRNNQLWHFGTENNVIVENTNFVAVAEGIGGQLATTNWWMANLTAWLNPDGTAPACSVVRQRSYGLPVLGLALSTNSGEGFTLPIPFPVVSDLITFRLFLEVPPLSTNQFQVLATSEDGQWDWTTIVLTNTSEVTNFVCRVGSVGFLHLGQGIWPSQFTVRRDWNGNDGAGTVYLMGGGIKQ